MSFSKDFYIQAEAQIKQRKAANDRLLAARQDEVSRKVPRYNEYQRELANTGNELVMILSGERTNVGERIRQLSDKNLLIQGKVEELLINNGYPPRYLNPIYTCEQCGDTGIYSGSRCVCFMDIVKRLASNALNDSSPIKLSSFELFDTSLYPDTIDSKTHMNIRAIMKDNLDYCRNYAENFHLPCASILMYGNTGLGKTHLSLAIANEVIKQGYSVIYGSAPDLFRKIEKEHFGRGEDNDTADLLQKTELLILDDLGAEFDSQFYHSALYNLVNTRMNASLPLIISTNLDLNQLNKRYGERLVSRFLSFSHLLFLGSDIRVIKSNG